MRTSSVRGLMLAILPLPDDSWRIYRVQGGANRHERIMALWRADCAAMQK